jgi:hypothetical protein
MRTDYLLWFMDGNPLPALVTTSPDQTPRLQAGVLGQPGTEILFGEQSYLDSLRSGGRIEFGGYFDACQEYGFGGGFFGIGSDRTNFVASSDGQPIIARPYFSTLTNDQASALVAYSSTADGDVMAGSVRAQTANTLMNANAYVTKLFRRGCGWRWDLLAGYRYSRFDEDLSIADVMTVTETGSIVPRGTTFDGIDSFDVFNEYQGADVGLQFASQYRRWSLDGLLKIGFGNMHQQVDISGQTFISQPGVPQMVRNGDFLVQDSNSGSFDRNQFACVPEARLNLSFFLTPTLRLTAGYTFVYWSNVIRAGQTVDTTVNPTQILPPVTGTMRPTFAFTDGDLWAQGLNFGTELKF